MNAMLKTLPLDNVNGSSGDRWTSIHRNFGAVDFWDLPL